MRMEKVLGKAKLSMSPQRETRSVGGNNLLWDVIEGGIGPSPRSCVICNQLIRLGYLRTQVPLPFWYHQPLAALAIHVLLKVSRTSFSHSGWPLARAISL